MPRPRKRPKRSDVPAGKHASPGAGSIFFHVKTGRWRGAFTWPMPDGTLKRVYLVGASEAEVQQRWTDRQRELSGRPDPQQEIDALRERIAELEQPAFKPRKPHGAGAVDGYIKHLVKDLVFRRDQETCRYCGVTLPPQYLELDHVIPRCQGGETSLLNLVAACVACNRKKNRFRPEQVGMALLPEPDSAPT